MMLERHELKAYVLHGFSMKWKKDMWCVFVQQADKPWLWDCEMEFESREGAKEYIKRCGYIFSKIEYCLGGY